MFEILDSVSLVLVTDILTQILLTLLTLIGLQILQNVSTACAKLLYGMCYYIIGIHGFHYGEHNLSWNVYL